MTKAKRAMKEDIKLIDLIIELVDARVSLSSRNPDIDELGAGKARMVLLNKSDLADDRLNEQWIRYFSEKGFHVLKVNCKSRAGLKQINATVQEACKEKIERDRRRGDLKPSGSGYGSGNPKRREVYIYQCICRKGLRKNRQ